MTEFLAQPARPPIPQAGKIHRACRHCAAAQNITSMVIVRARPHDYLCVRHCLWHHGIRDIDLRPVPQVTDAQCRHDQHVKALPASDVAHAHQQARDIIDEWIAWSWHPALTGQWQHRLRLIGAGDVRHPSPWLNAVTHPELLAVASLLLAARHRDIDVEHEAPSHLGFPYQPCPGEPLALSLLNSRKRQPLLRTGTTSHDRMLDRAARVTHLQHEEELARCLHLGRAPLNGPGGRQDRAELYAVSLPRCAS